MQAHATARVLSTCEGGIVVQFLQSNAVLRCRWPAGDVDPGQIKYRATLNAQLNQTKTRPWHKHEQIVTLVVQKCAPPELTVYVASLEQSTHVESKQHCAAGAEGPQRKRQFLSRLQ